MKDPVKYEVVGTDDLGNEIKRKSKGLFSIREMPKLQEVFYFGKYNRMKIKDIALKDPQYLNWMIKQEKTTKNMRASLRYWLNKYNKIE